MKVYTISHIVLVFPLLNDFEQVIVEWNFSVQENHMAATIIIGNLYLHVGLVFLLLTLNIFDTFFYCFCFCHLLIIEQVNISWVRAGLKTLDLRLFKSAKVP